MSRSSKDQPCKDCGKPCTGTRCKQCNNIWLGQQRARKPKKQRVRELRPARPRYQVPTPDPDRSPLKRDELAQAVCAQVDTEIFYAERGTTYREAELVCKGCPIAARCLAANLEDEYGFFAASPPARERILLSLTRPTETEGAA